MLQMIREVYPANKPKSSLSVVQQSHPVNGERRFALVTTENIGQPNEAITIDDTIGFVVSMRVNPDTTYKGKGFVGQIAFQKELNGNFEVEDIDAPVITVAP